VLNIIIGDVAGKTPNVDDIMILGINDKNSGEAQRERSQRFFIMELMDYLQKV